MTSDKVRRCLGCGKIIALFEPRIKLLGRDRKWYFVHEKCWQKALKGGDKHDKGRA